MSIPEPDGRPIPVTIPVTATVGPVWLGLFPPKAGDTSPDPNDWDDGLPWAWCALTHVTFRFGRRQTTKKVSARFRFADACDDRPDDAAVEVGRRAVLNELRVALADHGFTPPEFQIETAHPAPPRRTQTEAEPW